MDEDSRRGGWAAGMQNVASRYGTDFDVTGLRLRD